MNKLLLATTALVASTSFAMADVDLSGSAEMGIFGGEDTEDQFHTDIDVTFSMSGETDGGLTFGASVDIDEEIGDNNATTGGPESGATRNDSDDGGATIFVSGSLGTLTMGDTDGAVDFAMQEAIIGASLRDNHEHAGYAGNDVLDGFGGLDGQVARYDYSVGAFSVAVSAEVQNGEEGDDTYGISAAYAGEFGTTSFGIGLGYQQNDDANVIGFSANVSMDNGLQAVLNYSSFDDVFQDGRAGFGFDSDLELDNHLGLALGYQFGAFLVAANYGEFDYAGADVSGYGLIANYDLGGGAELQAGYGYNDFDGVEDSDNDTYSLGIAMSF